MRVFRQASSSRMVGCAGGVLGGARGRGARGCAWWRETRSALVLLFKQFVLATPKTRSLTITIGDIKITSPPVQHTHWQAARGQPGPRRFSSGQQQGHRVHNAKQRRSANRAAERAGQPPPYPKPSMVVF